MALRFWATMLLLASVAAGILNLTVLRDGEVASGVLLGVAMSVTTLVAARPRKGNR
jgi:hypothetical protein